MAKIEIEIGRGLEAAGEEIVAAWTALERGDFVDAGDDRIHFVDWSALCAVLTPKRYALLRHLRHAPAGGVRPLARALARDVRRVHEDVVALADLGLVRRAEDGGLTTPFDEIGSTIRIAA